MGLFDFLKPKNLEMIGRDITWVEIIGKVFKATKFIKIDSIDHHGRINRKQPIGPYGFLTVISPDYKNPVLLPIIHQDDFLLASTVFDDAELSKTIKKIDLLVTYIPKKILPNGFAGVHHALHYVMTPAQTIEKYYSVLSDQDNQPAIEKLFVNISWEGVLKVEQNLQPDI
ncbi:MAG: hypothetical protein HZA79_02250 [Sphingobacteriales bacterium]|nr:hypothetical protein [Sphingobacteriales bacterium]